MRFHRGPAGRFGVAMHTAAYKALGLSYVYVAFGTEDTAGAAAGMRALGIRGLGVTMPHKIHIMDYLDEIHETARLIGAVNTVVNDGGVLTGHNVDWIGAVRAIGERIALAGKRAAVVGAGMVKLGPVGFLDRPGAAHGSAVAAGDFAHTNAGMGCDWRLVCHGNRPNDARGAGGDCCTAGIE
ncbi:MAG: hypothetical protein HC814_07105 [Rhodobacteraceae bacterium]|nr:hypothetical protein [Paracoccaceae bacterium]